MKTVILGLCLLTITINLSAQTNSINDHARQVLELTGSGKAGIQVINNLTASFKKALPNVPPEFWEELSKEVTAADLVELMVPIYVKHYTDDELLQLIDFYKSPLGQKVIDKLPLITQDSYLAGQEWGKKLGEKIVNRLKEKGYSVNN
jgi:uncharacterized protein